MEFLILSMGGAMADEANATHVIAERTGKHRQNQERVQPQWLADCLNSAVLLSVQEYLPGKVLPPHLSPFVDNEKEGYVPERQKEIDA